MNKFTPGPWSYGICGDGSHYTIYIHQADNATYTPDYSDIAFQTCSGERRTIQEANARLIAAAPDLLEALEDCIDDAEEVLQRMIEAYGPKFRVERQNAKRAQIAKARAAIAKAAGEE